MAGVYLLRQMDLVLIAKLKKNPVLAPELVAGWCHHFADSALEWDVLQVLPQLSV